MGRKLILVCFPRDQTLLDLTPIADLTGLTHLHLDGYFSEESFMHLCHNLKQLLTLTLTNSSKSLSDDYLGDIHELKTLVQLSFDSTYNLTEESFEHISKMHSL